MDNAYVAAFTMLLWGMAPGVVITMLVLGSFFRIKRQRKLANLSRSSSDVIDEVLAGPIKDYVWELHEECIRARISLKILPLHAAAESEKSINKYWSDSIDKLMSVNDRATEGALFRHGLTREHPCQVMRPKQV
ncbi:MAG: hypothetical protein AB7P08_06215 [Burkholderiales bacterium]